MLQGYSCFLTSVSILDRFFLHVSKVANHRSSCCSSVYICGLGLLFGSWMRLLSLLANVQVVEFLAILVVLSSILGYLVSTMSYQQDSRNQGSSAFHHFLVLQSWVFFSSTVHTYLALYDWVSKIVWFEFLANFHTFSCFIPSDCP